ncbi:WD40 repeat domain-containing serine/threonine protein kinase [Kitasatospora sp. LaBMicrA B282]|uniref:WD40 repeat domain-containing serine/threonine protein kinase n=1 Tax=Kitasatospora sp. LaBMicrA B282 TaxID=3420949 RepID=UPI003D0F4448
MTWQVGDVIEDRYEVTRVHAAGAMGLVYRVRHLTWGTDLAVKSPRPELVRSARARELFTEEAETWVSLGLHPHVCSCHYVREIDGIPRVFAEYLDGGSLREHIQDRRLYRGTAEEVQARILDLAVQFAWGLQHAHEQGLVHQDVKPANVLLDRDGTAKITDFGLARAQSSAAGTAARPGAPAGGPEGLATSRGMTPAYASPEQFTGGRLGRSSDVYSFAASVLEMYTGAVTWLAGPAAGAALAQYRTDPRPGRRTPMPAALAELLARCLSHDPARRPRSAAEVAAELAVVYQRVTGERYPRPTPVAADLRADELNNKALSLLDLQRLAEAEQAFAAALAADPRHLHATYNRGLFRWRRGEITDEDLVTDLDALRAGTGDPWQARHLLAQVQLERGDLDAARSLLDGDGDGDEAGRPAEPDDPAHPDDPAQPDIRAAREVLRAGRAPDHRAAGSRTLGWHPPFDRPFRLTIRLTPDGRYAVTGYGSNTGPVRAIRLWDLRTGRLAVSLEGLSSWLSSVDVSADGRFAVSAGPDNEVRFWDLTAGRCLRSFAPPGTRRLYRVQCVRLDAGARTAVAVVEGRLWVWDFPSGQVRRQLGPAPDPDGDDLRLVELTEDGGLALVANRDRATIELWDLHTGHRRLDLSCGDHPTAIWLSPDGRTAATAATGLTIRLWDLRDGRCVRTVTAPVGEVRALALSGNSRYAVTGGEDGAVRLWDLALHRCLRTFRGHRGRVAGALIGADAGLALSVGEDDAARWWSLAPGVRHRAPLQLSRPRRHAEVDRFDGEVRALLAAAERASAERRYAAALDLLTRARAVPGFERAPAVLAAWRGLAGATVRVGLRGAWPVRVLAGQSAPHVYSVAISADGTVGVAGSGGGPVRLWDLTAGSRLPDLPKPLVGTVGLSADGQRAVSSGGGEIHVWSVASGRLLSRVDTAGPDRRSTTGEDGSPTAVSYSADGRLALAISRDRALRLWDLEGGRCLRVLTGQRGRPTAVHLAADGQRAVGGGQRGELLLWHRLDAEPLRLAHPGGGPLGEVGSVSLSADGSRLLSAGRYGDRTLRLWDTATGELLRVFEDQPAESMVARLTPDGRFALSGGRDAAVRIWDADTGRCLQVLDGHTGHVWSLDLTPDARFLLSGGSDGTLRLWELDWELAATP